MYSSSSSHIAFLYTHTLIHTHTLSTSCCCICCCCCNRVCCTFGGNITPCLCIRSVRGCACVCMCMCERERKRERAIVCLSVSE